MKLRAPLIFVMLIFTALFSSGCKTTRPVVAPPSLGGVTTAIRTAGDLNKQANVIAKEIYSKGTPSKSIPSAQLVGLTDQITEAHKIALTQITDKQAEINAQALELAESQEREAIKDKALAASTKWHLIFGWGFAAFTLAGVIGFFALKNHPYISWAFKIPFLGKFTEFAGLVVGGFAGAFAAFTIASVLISIWSGFGWFFKLFS